MAARRAATARAQGVDALVGEYRRAGATALFTRQTGGRSGYQVSEVNAARLIRQGTGAKLARQVVEAMPLPVRKSQMLEAIGISTAALSRREAADRPLDPAQAEKTIRTMELSTLATETFGTRANAATWLSRPHPLLEGRTPLEYANNAYGFSRVKSMLLQIRYGGVV